MKGGLMGNALSTPPRESRREIEPPQAPQHGAEPRSENNPQIQNFTCEICIEPMLSSNKFFKNRGKCNHPFCTDCMIKHIQAKLEDNIAKIPCPGLNCAQFLDPLTFQSIVSPELFVRWCDVLCENSLMGTPRSYCPDRNCSALILNECGGNVKKAVCPKCKRLFCFGCKAPWHSGFRCEESGLPRDQNDIAFGLLVEQKKWMSCPQCRYHVELIQGCRFVKCRCAATFCYVCGRVPNRNRCKCVKINLRRECLLYLVVIFVTAYVLALLLTP